MKINTDSECSQVCENVVAGWSRSAHSHSIYLFKS